MAVTFVVAALAALWLILAPPRLPGEDAPPETAASPLATTAPGSAGQPARPPAGSQGNAAPQGNPAGAPTPGTSPTAGAEKYTIKAGDTLGQIAAQYSTTVDALRAANPGLDEHALQIGQEILIPPR
jgi:LysM repeat protein